MRVRNTSVASMIVVRIELWPWGNPDTKRDLATIAIANDGSGNMHVGDYNYVVSHQAGSGFGAGDLDPTALMRTPELGWKHGKLEGFGRKKGAVALVAAVLRKAMAR